MYFLSQDEAKDENTHSYIEYEKIIDLPKKKRKK